MQLTKRLALRLTQGTKGSQSAKRLAQALTKKLGYKVWRSTEEKPKKKQLKYGHGVDKIAQYKWFQAQGLPALEFTTSTTEAAKWLEEGHTVIGRKLTMASCGKGIVIMEPKMDIAAENNIACPVYTKYKKKKREFRVHVFQDKVVAVMEKKLRKDWNGPRDSKIRNLANGYVFCSCDCEPEGVRELALKAGGVVSSDFKGVDIGYNEKKGDLFVIEVNSAPGMEGSRIDQYVNAILN
jgi:glutathione synthase/RimK-type ligase-like ATP-grasp enzyme